MKLVASCIPYKYYLPPDLSSLDFSETSFRNVYIKSFSESEFTTHFRLLTPQECLFSGPTSGWVMYTSRFCNGKIPSVETNLERLPLFGSRRPSCPDMQIV